MPKPTTHPKAPWWQGGTGFYGDFAFIKPRECGYELVMLNDIGADDEQWVQIIAASASFAFRHRAVALGNKPPHTDPERARKREEAIQEAWGLVKAWEEWYEEWKAYWEAREIERLTTH